MLAGDVHVQARLAKIEEVLRHVCGDEFPLFVSDEATVLDVCSLSSEQIVARIESRYGPKLGVSDLHLPIWQLIDQLEANS
jgi:hypothetical protein